MQQTELVNERIPRIPCRATAAAWGSVTTLDWVFMLAPPLTRSKGKVGMKGREWKGNEHNPEMRVRGWGWLSVQCCWFFYILSLSFKDDVCMCMSECQWKHSDEVVCLAVYVSAGCKMDERGGNCSGWLLW